jgi:enolase
MDVQDFLAVPIGAASYSEALHMTGRIRDVAAHVADRRGLSTLLADEGGLSPGCPTAVAALDFMMATIEHAGLKPGRDVAIAIDVAANGLTRADGGYVFPHEGRRCSGPEMVDLIASWIARYPIVSIEDGLHEEDWALWAQMTRRLGDVVQIVGDDLFTTNPERICKGLARGAANSVLVKLNQNGTVSGTLEAMEIARRGGLRTVISARSGETEDSFIADLAVGTAAGQIKIGSLRSSERLAKYNQLLRIEEDDMPYAGTAAPPLAVRDIASVGV